MLIFVEAMNGALCPNQHFCFSPTALAYALLGYAAEHSPHILLTSICVQEAWLNQKNSKRTLS